MRAYKTVDEYLANFPKDVQDKLKDIRNIIKEELPDAGEKISYGIPTATLEGKYIVYYAGYKNHISVYPVTEAVETLVKGIEEYRSGKGTLQFPLSKPLPITLIRNVIRARKKESVN